MESISAVGEYTLLKKGNNEQLEPAKFSATTDDGLQAVVEIDYATNRVATTIINIAVQDGFAEQLKGIGRFDFEKVPDHLKNEVLSISRTLSGVTKHVVSLIKYYLRHTGISEQLFSVKSVQWAANDGEYNELPSSISASFSCHSSEPLRANTISNVQLALDENIEPLIAMRHLHRAKKENIAHHKWIDATIAAELAVKEALSIAKPELEILLLEVPSPPLTKLYGPILEEYLGERSPFLKFIREGVEVRNRLVHKPQAEIIDPQEANDYVAHIEGAIFHLLSLIHPENKLILNACERTKL